MVIYITENQKDIKKYLVLNYRKSMEETSSHIILEVDDLNYMKPRKGGGVDGQIIKHVLVTDMIGNRPLGRPRTK